MHIKFNKRFIRSCEKKGLTILQALRYKGNYPIVSNFKLELPCALPAEILIENSSKIEMGAFSFFDKNVSIQSDIKVGRYCSIASDSKIGLQAHPTDTLSTSAYFYCRNYFNGWNKNFKDFLNLEPAKSVSVIIGNDVWIASDVKVNSGVKIGDGAIIGTGAIITKDVPPYAIVINRNEILRYRKKPEEFGKQDDWWNYDQVTNKKLSPYILTRYSLKKLSNRLRWFFN